VCVCVCVGGGGGGGWGWGGSFPPWLGPGSTHRYPWALLGGVVRWDRAIEGLLSGWLAGQGLWRSGSSPALPAWRRWARLATSHCGSWPCRVAAAACCPCCAAPARPGSHLPRRGCAGLPQQRAGGPVGGALGVDVHAVGVAREGEQAGRGGEGAACVLFREVQVCFVEG
jgi:hypothetical protein